MTLDTERPHTAKPEVECRTAFQLGSPYTMHSLQVTLNDQITDHRPSLVKLQDLFGTTSNNLHRDSESDTLFARELRDNPTYGIENNLRYIADYEGSFLIPWIVNARVVNGEFLIGYQVVLTRPDESLTYKVIQDKTPDFYYPSYGGHRLQKTRTRVDGLPVFLQPDEWQEPQPSLENPLLILSAQPNMVSILSRGIRPVSLSRQEGNSVTSAHKRDFNGMWREMWSFRDEGDGLKLRGIDITFNGKWGNPRKG